MFFIANNTNNTPKSDDTAIKLSLCRIIFECSIIFITAKIMLGFEWSQVVNPGISFIESVMRGDSWWFHNIAAHGYMYEVLTNDPIRSGQANWAFFPLFPFLMRVLGLTGLNLFVAGLVINQVQLFAALPIFILL